MSEYKLKIKIGDHEFEADGPADAVKDQFQAFKELIAAIPVHKPETIKPETPEQSLPPTPDPAVTPIKRAVDSSVVLDRIFREKGRVISLTAPPASETDAVLLIAYGQRFYRDNENSTGSEILDGMEESGYRKPRIDRILKGLADEGEVIITGAHRGKRYRLTNKGHAHAEAIVRDTLARLPEAWG
jgi:hypothetical protein